MWVILPITAWLLTGSVMDIRKRRVPIWLLLAGGIFSAATVILQCMAGGKEFADVLQGMLPGTGLLIVAFVTKKAGYGDGIALLCLGTVLGGGRSILLFGLSLFLISIFSLTVLVTRKAGRNTGIPYFPFLTGAWLIVAASVSI
ncbi:prepilin peptidase [Acetatifactor muris]|uniref:prepilin peptidase n=1 Tax=Acetatifactor muris TaxID=879566 RepID=UPI0023F50F92|nr:prepilin peptidase [Acetatifactor muris]